MKLNQKILVTTTSPLRGFTFRLEATTIVDVVNGWVKLGKGLWGACPSREINEVAFEVSDIDNLINQMEHLRELRDFGTTKKVLYMVVECRFGLEIQQFKFNRNIDSLKDGKYDSYTNQLEMGTSEIKVRDNKPPNNVHNTFEEAITKFKEVAQQKYLDKVEQL